MLKLLACNQLYISISVCSYDVVFTAGEKEILTKFVETKSNVFISAEDFCWPDLSLAVSWF